MEILRIVIIAFVSLAILFILTKIMGDRQMSELSMFDYITSITIGSIAAEMATSTSVEEIKVPLTAMIVYGLISALISYLTCKSMMMRRFFEGHPVMLFKNGQLYEKNLLKSKLDVNEFLAMCRVKGYFDLQEIYMAIMETDGKLSIIPKAIHRPVIPKDLKLEPQQDDSMANVIIDGNILKDNLKSTGKDEKWVEKQLSSHGVLNIKEVILATYDNNNNKLNIYVKNHRKVTRDIFQ
jgi:uncharacterized membrane protein YcaP (DUF421 family)